MKSSRSVNVLRALGWCQLAFSPMVIRFPHTAHVCFSPLLFFSASYCLSQDWRFWLTGRSRERFMVSSSGKYHGYFLWLLPKDQSKAFR
jgi:hypothetical protein